MDGCCFVLFLSFGCTSAALYFCELLLFVVSLGSFTLSWNTICNDRGCPPPPLVSVSTSSKSLAGFWTYLINHKPFPSSEGIAQQCQHMCVFRTKFRSARFVANLAGTKCHCVRLAIHSRWGYKSQNCQQSGFIMLPNGQVRNFQEGHPSGLCLGVKSWGKRNFVNSPDLWWLLPGKRSQGAMTYICIYIYTNRALCLAHKHLLNLYLPFPSSYLEGRHAKHHWTPDSVITVWVVCLHSYSVIYFVI